MLEDIEFIQLLGDVLYITFKGVYKWKETVIKFFHEMSDNDNEYEVLEYFRRNSNYPEWFPVPYFKVEKKYNTYNVKLGDKLVTIDNVYKIIGYQYTRRHFVKG